MNLPVTFLDRMRTQLGQEFPAFLASYDEAPVRGLRCAEGMDKDNLASMLGIDWDGIPYEETGTYLSAPVDGNHPLHRVGAYYLQDPSAMITAQAVEIEGGACVLDLCAAPGGKTTQLAHLVGKDGLLVSNEIDLGRAKILAGNVERMGFANTVVTNLPPSEVAKAYAGCFDVVVVDAPCSGEGMFRKSTVAVEEWSEDNVLLCAARQKEILAYAMQCVKKGGALVYSTCTFAPAEDEESVRFVLASGDFEQIPLTERVQKATEPGINQPLSRRFYPHQGRGEGHFVAGFRRITDKEVKGNAKLPAKLSAVLLKTVQQWMKDALCEPVEAARLTLVRNMVTILPAKLMASGMGLPSYGVICGGVQLGEESKGRIVPHHMMFKCMAGLFFNHTSVDLADERVTAYLHGDSIAVDDGQKGYGVLLVNGISAGGYKATQGEGKNLLPKGLRK